MFVYIKFHIRSTKNDGGGTVLLPADDESLDTIDDGKTTVEKDTKGYEMLIIVYDLQSNKYIMNSNLIFSNNWLLLIHRLAEKESEAGLFDVLGTAGGSQFGTTTTKLGEG